MGRTAAPPLQYAREYAIACRSPKWNVSAPFAWGRSQVSRHRSAIPLPEQCFSSLDKPPKLIMRDALSVSEVRDASKFLSLKSEWNELVEADPRATFFQTWEFQYHTWRIFADDVSLCLILIRNEEGELIGCAPLGSRLWRLGPLSARVLGFSSPKYCDYNNFILRSERADDALNALAQWFRENIRRWHVVELGPVREDSWVGREDHFLSRVGYCFRMQHCSNAPYLQLQPGWSTYEDALTKRHAKKLRYEIGKLLIDAGVDANALTQRKSTPLHSAARMTNVKIARLLLESGAKIGAQDADGATPLDWCRELNWSNADEIEKMVREFQRKN